MNPFDLKSALLAKHAQHVVLIHFPIALFLTGVAFDFSARWAKDVKWKAMLAAAAYLNLVAAAVFVLPTLATGIAAWQWQLAGQKLKGLLLVHLVLGSASGVLICLVARMHVRWRRASGTLAPRSLMMVEVFAVVVVAMTAHVGGFLSGVNIPS